MQAGLGKNLKECGYKYSLLTHRGFLTSRSVLKEKAILLFSLSKVEVEKLWECNLAGHHLNLAVIHLFC